MSDASTVLVLMPTYSGAPDMGCRNSLAKLRPGQVMQQSGISDVTLARNRLFTSAVDYCDRFSQFDVVLCVDDDMVFDADVAHHIIETARTTGRPASAVYAAVDGHIAAAKLEGLQPDRLGRPTWLVGLGFCAIPIAALRALRATLAPVAINEHQRIYAFCTSGPSPDGRYWESEDFSLCRRLGGVQLEAAAVGHVKRIPIWPDDATLARVAEGKALPKETDPRLQFLNSTP